MYEGLRGDDYDYPDFPERTDLIGGFSCRLTQAERNEFSEYLRALPVWRTFHMWNSMLRAACYRGNGNEVSEATGEYLAASEKLYQIGKVWYAGLQERRKQARDAARAANPLTGSA